MTEPRKRRCQICMRDGYFYCDECDGPEFHSVRDFTIIRQDRPADGGGSEEVDKNKTANK